MKKTEKIETPKQLEKGLLDNLWSLAGYFKDEFKEGDLALMRNNIDGDIPIFIGTTVGRLMEAGSRIPDISELHRHELAAKDSIIRAQTRDLDDANQRIAKLVETLVLTSADHYIDLDGIITAEEAIKVKLESAIPLTDEETKLVLSKI